METPTEVLVDLIGPVAFREYEAAPESTKPQLRAWARQLRDLSDRDFASEAASAIHGSAVMNSYRGNAEHVHCKASAVYHEAIRRHVAAGHDRDCRGDNLYSRAFRSVWRSQGYDTAAYAPDACDCGATRDRAGAVGGRPDGLARHAGAGGAGRGLR